MPNYVKNIIKMKGITSLPLYTVYPNGEKHFDFNKLIPMPESLNIESGSRTDECIVYYLTDRLALLPEDLDAERGMLVKTVVRNLFNRDWYKAVYERLQKRVKDMSQEEQDKMYQDGIQYTGNYQKYGATTWYEWCSREWGTKWNACETEFVGEDIVTFCTAWDNPEPVVMKLAEMYPDVKIEHWWADEDAGANTGYRCIDGDTIVALIPECGSAEAMGFFNICWGYDPEE